MCATHAASNDFISMLLVYMYHSLTRTPRLYIGALGLFPVFRFVRSVKATEYSCIFPRPLNRHQKGKASLGAMPLLACNDFRAPSRVLLDLSLRKYKGLLLNWSLRSVLMIFFTSFSHFHFHFLSF